MTTKHRKAMIREASRALGRLETAKRSLRNGVTRLGEAGRVLSAANEEKIKSAIDALAAVLDSLSKPDESVEAADAKPKCETCNGEGKIKAGTTKCPDCGGTGEASAASKEARKSRLLGLAEAYSAAADDAGDGAFVLSALLDLMSAESDEPGELSILQGAYSMIAQWLQLEVASIGSPDDVADSEGGDPSDFWGWEAARARRDASGGRVRPREAVWLGMRPLKGAEAPAEPASAKTDPADPGSAGGYTPEPYKADPDETVQCPMCGCMNSPDAKFCDQCGVALTGFHPSIGESRKLKTDLVPIREAAVKADGTGAIKIIAPGWGSSGYYAAEVLERDGPEVFPSGTKMFWDHPTVTEEWERPERSLRDLAAETTGPAVWNANGQEGAGLYAPVRVFAPYQNAVDELSKMETGLGVSIRAYGKAAVGEAEGQTGVIIEELVSSESIDFVTFPGAGGQVLSLFEAARQPSLTAPKEAQMEVEKDPKFVAEREARLKAEARNLLTEAKDVIAAKLTEAQIPAISRDRIAMNLRNAELPVKDGALDKATLEAKVAEAVEAEVEYLAKLTEAGKIKGMGGAPSGDPDPQPALEGAFRRLGLSESGAKVAAAGRSK